jgi:enoyl-CoA hydratase/carnithine racemase
MTIDDSGFRAVSYDVADGIATIRFARDARRNAMTFEMCMEIAAAFDLSDADENVRVVIVTGGDNFCVGADLDDGFLVRGRDLTPDMARYLDQAGTVAGVPRDGGGFLSLRIAGSLKPVIAAINGPAIGIGATLTLPMDIRVAGESARFGLVFARRGLVPEAASSWFLPRLVGISQAMEWVTTGRIFDASEARAGGLVSYVVPDDQVLGKAHELAREIADNTSPVAIATTRQMMWGMLSQDSPWAAHAIDSQAVYHLGAERDVAEGVRAFRDKRPARFAMELHESFPSYVPRWPHRPKDLA